MQRIFVTHIVPSDKILKCHLSVAACNFSFNLIEGNVFDKVFSILPTFVNGKLSHLKGLFILLGGKRTFYISLLLLLKI